jgi:hypothetical protein
LIKRRCPAWLPSYTVFMTFRNNDVSMRNKSAYLHRQKLKLYNEQIKRQWY